MHVALIESVFAFEGGECRVRRSYDGPVLVEIKRNDGPRTELRVTEVEAGALFAAMHHVYKGCTPSGRDHRFDEAGLVPEVPNFLQAIFGGRS